MRLSDKDLGHLTRLLQSYSTKWDMIGLSLGFIQCELNIISGMPKLFVGAPVSYLQELLSQWVQWPTTDHPSHPTLGALCTALRSSLVGLGSLAEEVEREMKQYAAGKKKMHQVYHRIPQLHPPPPPPPPPPPCSAALRTGRPVEDIFCCACL